MNRFWRSAIIGSALPLFVFGADLRLPLEGGEIVFKDVTFIRVDADGKYLPELSFKVENHTALPWWSLEVQFRVSGHCNGKERNWVISATTSLGWSDDHIVGNVYNEEDDSLEGKVDGCKAETF